MGGPTRRWPRALGSLVQRDRPDVVHLHATTPGSLGVAAVRLAGHRRIVYTGHRPHASLPPLLRSLRRLAAGLPAVNVAVSEAVARSLIHDARAPEARVVVIRNGVPPAEPLSGPGGGPPVLVYVANFWPHKAHGVLLEAMRRLGEANGQGPSRLVLIGDGPLRRSVEDQVVRAGLAGRVTTTGYLHDPWSVTEGAWGYVHPATIEGMPLAVMEAMVRGLPVVASTVSGIPEAVVDGVSGYLSPAGDAGALAESLARLLSDRRRRDEMGAAARRHALANLRLEECMESYLDLYRRLAGWAARAT